MATKRYRRFSIHVPYLANRGWPKGSSADEKVEFLQKSFDSAMQELSRFLRYMQDGADDGLPAGDYDEIPEGVSAGSSGGVGDPSLGWAPGTHEHPVPVGVPEPTGLANDEGSSEELVRRDHVHLANSIVDGNLVTDILFVDTGTVTWSFTIVGDDIQVRAEVAPGQVIAAPQQPTPHTHLAGDVVGPAERPTAIPSSPAPHTHPEWEVLERNAKAAALHSHPHVHRFDELVGEPDNHARFNRQAHTHRYEDVRADGTETVLANQIFGG